MILKTAQGAIDQDDAEVICLGCAGMTGLDKRMERDLGVPVLDGVVCALKLLEGLVSYGVSTSKKRAYSQPAYKPVVGLPPNFQRVYQPKK